jgi:hypothetical protein
LKVFTLVAGDDCVAAIIKQSAKIAVLSHRFSSAPYLRDGSWSFCQKHSKCHATNCSGSIRPEPAVCMGKNMVVRRNEPFALCVPPPDIRPIIVAEVFAESLMQFHRI